MSGIPIFIFSFNRLTVLQQSIASFNRLRPQPQIVIYDTGSTYQPLLDYLDTLSKESVIIYRDRPKIDNKDKLNLISEAIEDYFLHRPLRNYAVTDPDIAFCDECPVDVLDLYSYFLEAFSDVTGVGPMLRIDDLPDAYPLKQRVILRHTEQFYDKQRNQTEWRGREVFYQYNYIDTTFGLYRGGSRFRRASRSIRIYGPYWARHLDWYIDPANMTDDQKLYLLEASDVSHWGGSWLKDAVKPSFDPSAYAFKF